MRYLPTMMISSGAALLLLSAASVLAGIWTTDGRFHASAVVFFILSFVAFIVGDVTRGKAKDTKTNDEWMKK